MMTQNTNSDDQRVSWGELQAKLGKNIVPCFLLCSTSVTALRLEVTDSPLSSPRSSPSSTSSLQLLFQAGRLWSFSLSLSLSPLSSLSAVTVELQNKKKIFHLSPAHFTKSAFGRPALSLIKPSQTSLASVANWEEVSPSASYVIHPMTLRCNCSVRITILTLTCTFWITPITFKVLDWITGLHSLLTKIAPGPNNRKACEKKKNLFHKEKHKRLIILTFSTQKSHFSVRFVPGWNNCQTCLKMHSCAPQLKMRCAAGAEENRGGGG